MLYIFVREYRTFAANTAAIPVCNIWRPTVIDSDLHLHTEIVCLICLNWELPFLLQFLHAYVQAMNLYKKHAKHTWNTHEIQYLSAISFVLSLWEIEPWKLLHFISFGYLVKLSASIGDKPWCWGTLVLNTDAYFRIWIAGNLCKRARRQQLNSSIGHIERPKMTRVSGAIRTTAQNPVQPRTETCDTNPAHQVILIVDGLKSDEILNKTKCVFLSPTIRVLGFDLVFDVLIRISGPFIPL